MPNHSGSRRNFLAATAVAVGAGALGLQTAGPAHAGRREPATGGTFDELRRRWLDLQL